MPAYPTITTLGDLLIGGASGVEARLPGNTSTGLKFLRSVGDGSSAAAPSWEELDIASVSGLTAAMDGKETIGAAATLAATLGDLATLDGVTKSLVSDLETITATPTASAIPKADGSGKISPSWIDMLNGITLGTSAASKAVTADANNSVGIGTAPDPSFRLTATSIKSSGNIQAETMYVVGGLSVGDSSIPIPGGLLFARSGAAEPFIRLACNGGATGISQIRGPTGGGLKVTKFDGSTPLLEIGATGNVNIWGGNFAIKTSDPPASATAIGNAGDIRWGADYIYVCTATNTWKRTAIASW